MPPGPQNHKKERLISMSVNIFADAFFDICSSCPVSAASGTLVRKSKPRRVYFINSKTGMPSISLNAVTTFNSCFRFRWEFSRARFQMYLAEAWLGAILYKVHWLWAFWFSWWWNELSSVLCISTTRGVKGLRPFTGNSSSSQCSGIIFFIAINTFRKKNPHKMF